MTYTEIIDKVSKDLNIPLDIVKLAYESYWKFIRETIIELPLKEKLSEEEFSLLRTNFNIPTLGKLTCTYDRYKGVKKRLRILMKIRNENKES